MNKTTRMASDIREQLEIKQQYYLGLDRALADSDDEQDLGQQSSYTAMRKARERTRSSIAGSKESRTLPRSVSETNMAAKDPLRRLKDQAVDQRPVMSSTGEPRTMLKKGATFSVATSKAMMPTAPPSAIPRSVTGKRKRESEIRLVPKPQQIFKGMHFYFFPNEDKNPARAMRIIKALEFGATWQREWHDSVTHVIVDKVIDYGLLMRFLKMDRLPDHVILVSESYPAECFSYRAVLNPKQSQFRVRGAPEHEMLVSGNEKATTAKQILVSSEKSLELKPAGRSVMAKQPATQVTTTDEATSSQPTIDSRVEKHRASDSGKEGGATEKPLGPLLSPADTSDEFEAAVKQARELQHLPFDHDEEEVPRPASSGGPPDTDDEDATEEVSKQRKPKFHSMQDKFQCMQKHTGNQSDNPNAGTIQVLQQMADYYGQVGDEWRIRAYRKAIGTLRNHPTKIWTREDAMALPQVGPRLATKIEEIAFTNRLRRLESAKAEPKDSILQTFMGVYGAGLTTANEWINAGYKTLDDVLEKANVTDNQRIGIEHYSDFQTRIPRAEVETHGSIVRRALQKIDGKFEVIVGGSYRRGSKDSGDVDCIITRPDTGAAHLRNVVLGQLVPNLVKAGFLVASLAATRRDDGSKWHGASQLPSFTSPNPNPWRRIDLLLVPSDEIGAALIYFTGNDIFCRSIRLLASTKGMRLNQRGLYKDCIRGANRVKITEGQLVEGRDEKKIFAALGVPWRPPEHRIC
ncbi:hypothetical protein B0A50_05866 [Salinomyces thailandicus]|uniref:DNA polymerase lambda n=1 Tax=Salinomyces thailandicus TaxID=706561 RepID=A0A4V6WJQ7_9PEZI|nr:hypothetical protein B0A50_05866 [Salinomyces thailandica]